MKKCVVDFHLAIPLSGMFTQDFQKEAFLGCWSEGLIVEILFYVSWPTAVTY